MAVLGVNKRQTRGNVMKREEEIFLSHKNGLALFSIFLEVYMETEKGQSYFCSWCIFSSVFIFILNYF